MTSKGHAKKCRRGETNPAIDYMSIGYEHINEPLRLLSNGQNWFMNLYNAYKPDAKAALLLGAVQWMADFLTHHHKKIYIVDHSRNQLKKLNSRHCVLNHSSFIKLQNNWLDIPNSISDISVIFSDNSLTYQKFPEEWDALLSRLYETLNKDAVIFARVFSAPRNHISESVIEIIEIIEQYRNMEDINYTELRTRILFSILDKLDYKIDTELALQEYLDNYEMISSAIPNDPESNHPNDLDTLRKYHNTNLIYYAPPEREIKKIISKYFTLLDIAHGPYVLSEYFPLFIAKKA